MLRSSVFEINECKVKNNYIENFFRFFVEHNAIGKRENVVYGGFGKVKFLFGLKARWKVIYNMRAEIYRFGINT